MKSRQVLQLLQVSRVTLTKYVKSQKIRTTKNPNGSYNYNDEDVYKILGIEHSRKNVIYARVSTYKQKQDLENQIATISAFMNKEGVRVDSVYSDIKTGMHLDRNGFTTLLDEVQANQIDTVYISYKDRLARLSYGLVEKLFSAHNVRIEIINNSKKSDEQELFEDLMQVIHGFSMKMYSKRRLAKKLTEKEKKLSII